MASNAGKWLVANISDPTSITAEQINSLSDLLEKCANEARLEALELRAALEEIESNMCACHDTADANWHGKKCPKGIAIRALKAAPAPSHDPPTCEHES